MSAAKKNGTKRLAGSGQQFHAAAGIANTQGISQGHLTALLDLFLPPLIEAGLDGFLKNVIGGGYILE